MSANNDLLNNFTGMALTMKLMLRRCGGVVELGSEEIQSLQNLGPDVRIQTDMTADGKFRLKLVREDSDGNTTPVE